MTKRPVLFLIALLAVFAAGCSTMNVINQAEKDKADVKAALEKHLKEKGTVNLDAMTWEMKEYNQDRDRAQVQLLFTSKAGGRSMPVSYELKKENGVWVVQKPSGGSGHPESAMPPGTSMPPAAPGGALPAGHPPVGGTAPSKTTEPMKSQPTKKP
jgi:hypothetical protein